MPPTAPPPRLWARRKSGSVMRQPVNVWVAFAVSLLFGCFCGWGCVVCGCGYCVCANAEGVMVKTATRAIFAILDGRMVHLQKKLVMITCGCKLRAIIVPARPSDPSHVMTIDGLSMDLVRQRLRL